jgi:hypothetical protein
MRRAIENRQLLEEGAPDVQGAESVPYVAPIEANRSKNFDPLQAFTAPIPESLPIRSDLPVQK